MSRPEMPEEEKNKEKSCITAKIFVTLRPKKKQKQTGYALRTSFNRHQARDKVRLETLRNIKKVFLEAKTAPGADDNLSDANAMKILQKLAKQGKESAETYAKQNRQDLADAELAQVAVIEEYLPKPFSPEEVEEAVKTIISQIGATSMKDMGRVMGVATKQLAGKADGGAISQAVKKALA